MKQVSSSCFILTIIAGASFSRAPNFPDTLEFWKLIDESKIPVADNSNVSTELANYVKNRLLHLE